MCDRPFLLACLLLALGGCQKGKPEAPAEPAKPAVDPVEVFTKTTLPAIQATRGADAPAITFEAQKDEDDRLIIAVPKGWEPTVMPGSFKPTADMGLGFMTSYTASTNCDGLCAPKEWKSVVEKVEFDQFRRDSFKIEREEALATPEGKLIIAKASDRTYVAVARWATGKSRYYSCSATLDKPAASLVSVFTEACLRNKILFF